MCDKEILSQGPAKYCMCVAISTYCMYPGIHLVNSSFHLVLWTWKVLTLYLGFANLLIYFYLNWSIGEETLPYLDKVCDWSMWRYTSWVAELKTWSTRTNTVCSALSYTFPAGSPGYSLTAKAGNLFNILSTGSESVPKDLSSTSALPFLR